MGAFNLSSVDMLVISVALNTCFLLQMIMTRVISWAKSRLDDEHESYSAKVRTLWTVHQQWPRLLGRILMEQLTLFILLIFILINLGFVTPSIHPFQEHTDNNRFHLTRVILGGATARFLIIAFNLVFADDVTPLSTSSDQSKLSIQGSETGNAMWHFVYCVFGIVSNVIGLGYKQNLLLLGTSSFMELNSTSLVIFRLIKLANLHRGSQSYFKTSVLCCAMCLFSRVLLPILFLCLALSQESPFVMDTLPLTWFFMCGTFYFLFHTVLVYNSFKRITKAFNYSNEVKGRSCHQRYSSNEPFSILNYPDRLTNDIFDEALLQNQKEGLEDGCDLKISSNFKDFNYGLLPSYDNRNLCSFVSRSEEEKMNFLQKKNCSKHEFLLKFISKGVPTNSNRSSPNRLHRAVGRNNSSNTQNANQSSTCPKQGNLVVDLESTIVNCHSRPGSNSENNSIGSRDVVFEENTNNMAISKIGFESASGDKHSKFLRTQSAVFFKSGILPSEETTVDSQRNPHKVLSDSCPCLVNLKYVNCSL